MKKILMPTLLAGVLLLSVSCQKEENPVPQPASSESLARIAFSFGTNEVKLYRFMGQADATVYLYSGGSINQVLGVTYTISNESGPGRLDDYLEITTQSNISVAKIRLKDKDFPHAQPVTGYVNAMYGGQKVASFRVVVSIAPDDGMLPEL